MELAPRDLCDTIHALCNLGELNGWGQPNSQSGAPNPVSNKWIEKELRILAKRAAFMLPQMDGRQRCQVRDSFASVDFYDADLVQVLKKLKLVKGKEKR